jgi:hypothetical protein
MYVVAERHEYRRHKNGFVTEHSNPSSCSGNYIQEGRKKQTKKKQTN